MLAGHVDAFETEVLRHSLIEACCAALGRGYPPDAIKAAVVDEVLSQIGLRRDDPAAAELVESVEGATHEVIRFIEACEALEREIALLEPTEPPAPAISTRNIRISLN